MGAAARLNPQGLARRDRGLMSCIIADPGETICSIDLSAGEPTVTAHFSQDPNYRYACFDGVGKTPFYQNGILMLSDIYLMTASVSPIGRQLIWDAFHSKYRGNTFAEQWLIDDEVIKKELKALRQLTKMLCLALGYGLGPAKMVKQCYENGYSMDIKTARNFFASYWQLFAGVKRLGDKLAAKFKRDGYLVNPFGYRLVPDKEFKALNYYVQSTVSGIMHVFCMKLLAIAPYAKFITVIHDELLASLPKSNVIDFKERKERATASLNKDLNWSVNIRTGYAIGDNLYDAK